MADKQPLKVSATVRQKSDKADVTVSIEEIENGFLITRNKDWQDSKGQYHYETKKWYSATNPLGVDSKNNKELAAFFN